MSRECVLILDNLRSVENTASIFRTADGFGVGKIVLVGTTPTPIDRFGRERKDFVKVSLGSEKSVEWEYKKEIKDVLKVLKGERQIISLEQHPKSKRLKDFVPDKKFALIVGSEVDGVSQEALEASDEIVEIPMMGMKESLNVSVAAGATLFHLLK